MVPVLLLLRYRYKHPRYVEEENVFSAAELRRIFDFVALVGEGGHWMHAGLGSAVHSTKTTAPKKGASSRRAELIALSKVSETAAPFH
jgi:hypothetical protein